MKKKILLSFTLICSLLTGCSQLDAALNEQIQKPMTEAPSEMISEDMQEFQSFDLSNVSSVENYYGEPSVKVNSNKPYFSEEELEAGRNSFEKYSDLDSLGRVGVAFASLSSNTMPKRGELRGEIGSIKPTGWETKKYDCINGMYLYNRCHLIAWCLSSENANPQNLCTGTRYMNVDGMLSYEEKVAKYLDENPDNHVLYRITPVFEGDNLLCNGVLMEAQSVEDDGYGITFCVFCYNVQPGIQINYATGESSYTGIFLDKEANSVK